MPRLAGYVTLVAILVGAAFWVALGADTGASAPAPGSSAPAAVAPATVAPAAAMPATVAPAAAMPAAAMPAAAMPAAATPAAAAPPGALPGASSVAPPLGFQFTLPDPEYASRLARPQSEPAIQRIRWLTHPTQGTPAIAQAGGRLVLRISEAITWPAKGLVVTLHTKVLGATLHAVLPVSEVTPLDGGRQSQVACLVPAHLPRESYDLAVTLPDGRSEGHARAVRVLHSGGPPYRLAVLADHQLSDPSGRVLYGSRNPGSFPGQASSPPSLAIARQGLEELDLVDPDLVLHLGDLVFGLEPEKEFGQAMELLSQSGVAAFFVPGNHDGYARYGVDLKASLPALATGMLRCRGELPSGEEATWRRIWGFLTCVYGDLRPVLFQRLISDGLVSWSRKLGPTHYAFDLAPFRFIGLNTYDGTPERRHAFSLWVDIRGLHLGAPMVDNYGGYLSVSQLRWLQTEVEEAGFRGQPLVLFGHHDPRGNVKGDPYHENQPFPSNPVGPNHFEAWNYDGAWDSDPSDGRGPESATQHSGHSLIELLARHGGTYLSGHVHYDHDTHYGAGQPIRDGIVAARPLDFLKVTTASAAPGEDGYWGYRLLTLERDGTLGTSPFAEDLGLLSVPAGNLWLEPGKGGQEVARLYTGLPRPQRVRVRALLSHHPAGYRFEITPASARVELVDVAPVWAGKALYYLAAQLPAAGAVVARSHDAVKSFSISAIPLERNAPPRPRLSVNGQPRKPGARVTVRSGAAVLLGSRGSADPDGQALLTPIFQAADGRGGRGSALLLTAPDTEELEVRLILRDAQGAAGEARVILVPLRAILRVPGQSPASAPWLSPGQGILLGGLVLLVLGVGLMLWGRRRRK